MITSEDRRRVSIFYLHVSLNNCQTPNKAHISGAAAFQKSQPNEENLPEMRGWLQTTGLDAGGPAEKVHFLTPARAVTHLVLPSSLRWDVPIYGACICLLLIDLSACPSLRDQ